ncbi:ABC transporter permease, partial [Vibrio parahaemolyticus]|nr:ABC transporter permease [Vibrio parahaemolyticus]
LDSVLEIERQVHEQETNLKAQLQKAERRKKLRSIMLTTPLVCFILLTFAFPILDMLYRSVDNREISLSLPQTIQALESWDYQGQPHQEVIEAFSVEVLALYQRKELPKIANRMNIEESGMRSLLMKTGRKLSRLTSLPSSVTQLAKLDKRWTNPKYWAAFKNLSGALTFSHYLAALDLQVNEFGDIEPQPEKRQIYVDLFFKTFWMSISI